jgi:hypothetical protein
MIFFLGTVHGSIKIIEELIAQHFIVNQVKLASTVVEALLVSNAWEIQPLWMPKFIS